MVLFFLPVDQSTPGYVRILGRYCSILQRHFLIADVLLHCGDICDKVAKM